MTIQKQTSPTNSQLWRGAVLSTIAHAIAVVADPSFAYELGWDGPNYVHQDSQGTRGTVTFLDGFAIGAFCDDNSPRAPWNSEGTYDLQFYLAEMPDDVRVAARDQTLKYLYDEWDEVSGPIITAVFWSDNEYTYAGEPWQDVVFHGAHLLRIELMETEQAIQELRAEYEFSELQVTLLRQLFNRKVAQPDSSIELNKQELEMLQVNGSIGLTEGRELLASIGFLG